MTDWYERRNELETEQVFQTTDGSFVKLDRRVPGDGTKWYVATWWNDSWAHMDGTIEPGDLVSRVYHHTEILYHQLQARVRELEAERTKFADVLEFYALHDRYDYDETCCPDGPNKRLVDVLSDGGELARIALGKTK